MFNIQTWILYPNQTTHALNVNLPAETAHLVTHQDIESRLYKLKLLAVRQTVYCFLITHALLVYF